MPNKKRKRSCVRVCVCEEKKFYAYTAHTENVMDVCLLEHEHVAHRPGVRARAIWLRMKYIVERPESQSPKSAAAKQ